jgi:DDE superfamily endonuclease
VVSYRVMLDVPRELVQFVSGLLAARRREIGTRKGTRKLGCYRQALFGLAWFRDKGDIPWLGAGFGLAQSTAYRYLDEVIDVLAAQAPGLHQALERALAEGTPYLTLDGKVVDTDRCREKTVSRKGKTIDVWYSGKTHDFGGNIQALFYPSGIPLWISDVLPGNVHDLAAARENVLAVVRPFLEAMPLLADPGHEGAGHGVHIPVKKPAAVKELDINTRARNALLRSARCLGERGFALLTQRWRTLQHVTTSPGKIGLIARAALVLVLFEHKPRVPWGGQARPIPASTVPAGRYPWMRRIRQPDGARAAYAPLPDMSRS